MERLLAELEPALESPLGSPGSRRVAFSASPEETKWMQGHDTVLKLSKALRESEEQLDAAHAKLAELDGATMGAV